MSGEEACALAPFEDAAIGAPLRDLPVAARQPLNQFLETPRRLAQWRQLDTMARLPMQDPSFIAATANRLSAARDIRIYYVADSKGLAALFPTAADKGLLGRLRVVGEDELGEPIDALCREPRMARLLAQTLVEEGRVIDLDRLPADSPLIGALAESIAGRGRISVRPAKGTPTIALNAAWKDPAAQFNSGRRSDFRRAARRAAEYGETRFEILSPTAGEFDALFDEAIQVEARSWKREVGTAMAVDRCKESFFRDYFRSACEQGQFRLALMRIDGQLVAVQMALECKGRYWLFKIGFDEAFARCSPGTLLMLHTIGWAAERNLRAYEFLGNVEPWIAQLWTREAHAFVRLRVYPYNLRGAVAFGQDSLAWLRKRVGAARQV